jgi:hypothetical protein
MKIKEGLSLSFSLYRESLYDQWNFEMVLMAFFLLAMAGFKQQIFDTEVNSFTSALVHYAKLQHS